jgi:hypothetical protein
MNEIDSIDLVNQATYQRIRRTNIKGKNGIFKIENLPIGTYNINVFLKEFNVISEQVTLCSNCKNAVSFQVYEHRNHERPFISVEEMPHYGNNTVAIETVFQHMLSAHEIEALKAYSNQYTIILYLTHKNKLSDIVILPIETPFELQNLIKHKFKHIGPWFSGRINGKQIDNSIEVKINF